MVIYSVPLVSYPTLLRTLLFWVLAVLIFRKNILIGFELIDYLPNK